MAEYIAIPLNIEGVKAGRVRAYVGGKPKHPRPQPGGNAP